MSEDVQNTKRLQKDVHALLKSSPTPFIDWKAIAENEMTRYRAYALETIQERIKPDPKILQALHNNLNNPPEQGLLGKLIRFGEYAMYPAAAFVFTVAALLMSNLDKSAAQATGQDQFFLIAAIVGAFAFVAITLLSIAMAISDRLERKRAAKGLPAVKIQLDELNTPGVIKYSGVLESSIDHPGGVVAISKSYPKQKARSLDYITETKDVGRVVLDDGGIDNTAEQFHQVLQMLQVQEAIENTQRDKILTSYGLDEYSKRETALNLWDEVESKRERNELNPEVVAVLNEIAKDQREYGEVDREIIRTYADSLTQRESKSIKSLLSQRTRTSER